MNATDVPASMYFFTCILCSVVGALVGMNSLSSDYQKNISQLEKLQVDPSIASKREDVNLDGIDDLILQRMNGEKIILYGTNDGNYSFKDTNFCSEH